MDGDGGNRRTRIVWSEICCGFPEFILGFIAGIDPLSLIAGSPMTALYGRRALSRCDERDCEVLVCFALRFVSIGWKLTRLIRDNLSGGNTVVCPLRCGQTLNRHLSRLPLAYFDVQSRVSATE